MLGTCYEVSLKGGMIIKHNRTKSKESRSMKDNMIPKISMDQKRLCYELNIF